ncbi:phosphatase PAP2 family protein [Schlesneria sp. T3-172]|uniref:phosphatase PAP2 family protein n=1 Tax=Schlesneria TaxID=656899 RepID=UPI002F1D9CF4
MNDTLINPAHSRDAINLRSDFSSPHTVTAAGRKSWPVWRPLIATLLVSLLIRIWDVDQHVSAMFYDSGNGIWPFERAHPWLWFYRNGVIPPIVVGVVGAVVAVFGTHLLHSKDPLKIKQFRLSGLFLALLLIIGPGLLVNGFLKSVWGRPRPVQCTVFGGDKQFLPVGAWGSDRFPNSSFPSGHAAVAFYLIGLGFVVSPKRPWLRRACFAGGLIYGVAMGFTRVLQGGHFTSDVVWAGALTYLVAVALSRMLIDHDEQPAST